MKVKLTDEIIKSFKIARVHRDNPDKVINAMDFSNNGEQLVTCTEDDQIFVYEMEKGAQTRLIKSKKYGVDLIRCTHAPNAVLHASTKGDDTIRYLSLHDNKYLRYFGGHTEKVISLCVSPVDDTFISGSMDKTIRLWDLRSPSCVGCLTVPAGRPIAGYDPEGLIFAAGVNSECVKLFDLRSFDKGPFVTFKLCPEKDFDWTGLKFSRDGKLMLISTNGPVIRMLDAFHGTPLQSFGGFANTKGVAIEASFTPDTAYVFSGSTDGLIHVWNSDTGYKTCVLNGNHPGVVARVQFNPKFAVLASACSHLGLWQPDDEVVNEAAESTEGEKTVPEKAEAEEDEVQLMEVKTDDSS